MRVLSQMYSWGQWLIIWGLMVLYDMTICQISKGFLVTSGALTYLTMQYIDTPGSARHIVGALLILITQTIYGPTNMYILVTVPGLCLLMAYGGLSGWPRWWYGGVQLLVGVVAMLSIVGYHKQHMASSSWWLSGLVVFVCMLWYTHAGLRLLKQLREGIPL